MMIYDTNLDDCQCCEVKGKCLQDLRNTLETHHCEMGEGTIGGMEEAVAIRQWTLVPLGSFLPCTVIYSCIAFVHSGFS
ncbi:hypothetical protein TNCV_2683501 [Trichonephila clavipes]|nr:hypothetical protein TNCV_2683501 [Trichonephila clavipes]